LPISGLIALPRVRRPRRALAWAGAPAGGAAAPEGVVVSSLVIMPCKDDVAARFLQ
jgi:hypothetical protein